jgi:phospholipid/cholesterol/gamma-HCH transport system substrate-binding protein
METLERGRLGAGLAVVAVMAVLTWISIVAINGVPFSGGYKVRALVPANAPLLKDGDDVRIAGRRAGQVKKISYSQGGALISMNLDKGPIGPGARAVVRLRGLAGAVYVELHRGDISHPLDENALIPRSATSAGTQLTDVVEGFHADTRAALSKTLSGYGIGLAGHGDELNHALAVLPETLQDTTPLMRALAPRPGELSGTLGELRRTMRGFAGPEGENDLAALLPSAAQTVSALAPRRGEPLRETVERLPGLEDQLAESAPPARALLAQATVAARRLTPAAQALAAALPDVNGLASTGAKLPQLVRLTRAADPVVRAGRPLVRELWPALASLAPLGDALDPLAVWVARYPRELMEGPGGFTRWGKFPYQDGVAKGAKAVRFSMVFTCHRARDPYPGPGAADNEEKRCRS